MDGINGGRRGLKKDNVYTYMFYLLVKEFKQIETDQVTQKKKNRNKTQQYTNKKRKGWGEGERTPFPTSDFLLLLQKTKAHK